jgi:hypothetical protein
MDPRHRALEREGRRRSSVLEREREAMGRESGEQRLCKRMETGGRRASSAESESEGGGRYGTLTCSIYT